MIVIIITSSIVLATLEFYIWQEKHIVYMVFDTQGLLCILQTVIFSLQYLRSSLTVPLHFERRYKLDCGRVDQVPAIDRKIRCYKYCIFTLQIVMTVLICLILIFELLFRSGLDWEFEKINSSVLSFIIVVILCSPLILTPTAIIFGLCRIKKWIDSDLAEPYGRKWKCQKDGLFLVFLILTLILHILGLCTFLFGEYIIAT